MHEAVEWRSNVIKCDAARRCELPVLEHPVEFDLIVLEYVRQAAFRAVSVIMPQLISKVVTQSLARLLTLLSSRTQAARHMRR